MKKIISAILVLTLIYSPPILSQGKIKKSKRELKAVRQESRGFSASSVNTEPSNDINYGQTLEEYIVGLLATGVVITTFYSTIGNYKGENHLHSLLSAYPYANGAGGNYVALHQDTIGRKFRIDLENSAMIIDKNLWGNHLKVKIRPLPYFYLQTDYVQLTEYMNEKEKNDYLSLFGFNIGYDRLKFNKINFGWTLGMNYVGSGVKKAGFTYGAQVEWFLPCKISLYGSGRFSQVNHEPLNAVELKIRYHIERWYATCGYEFHQIASPQYHFGTLGLGLSF